MCVTCHHGFICLLNLICWISAVRLQKSSKLDLAFILSPSFMLTLINVAVGQKGPILLKGKSQLHGRKNLKITIYAPMIYTAPCIMFWMRAYSLLGHVGGG
jgi:hypothetical protein